MRDFVICYRCLHGYSLSKAPRRTTKRLKVKEPSCPKCKCKVYFNRSDSSKIELKFDRQNTSGEED